MEKTNIFITGFSGTGKSTVGKHLAKMLGWTFVDTDRYIERQKDKSISVSDNGIGMNKTDLIENLGTVARSGTRRWKDLCAAGALRDRLGFG